MRHNDTDATRRSAGGPAARGHEVAVVAVWSPDRRDDRSGLTQWEVMDAYCRLINDTTALRALPTPVIAEHPQEVAQRIAGLDEPVAVFTFGLGPTGSAAVQSITAESHPAPVLSETDVLTATTAAEVLTALRGKGIPPQQGRVAVTAAEHAPRLESVLLECGARTVTARPGRQFHGPMMRKLLIEHDIIVDCSDDTDWTAPVRTVALPSHRFPSVALALPGLLSALCGHGTREVTTEALAAAARALALLAPVDQRLPDQSDPRLVPVVAGHVTSAISGIADEPRPYR